MIDTLKLKKPLPEGSKAEFEDADELLEYLISLDKNDLPAEEIGMLYPLPEEEITDELREKFDQIEKRDISTFIDIR